jgi:ATP-binding protein involved in chromosome partitioning
MGQLIEPGKAIAWRGPMTAGALGQLVDADWGVTDTLVVDLPPGTGDVQLTLVQKLRIDGAVLVTTPQEIALIDARRAASMFEKTATPILGLIENMAFFPDPSTGAPIPIFGEGGGVAEAARLNVPLLGRVPIEIAVRLGGDQGVPAVIGEPKGQAAQVFVGAAQQLWEAIG